MHFVICVGEKNVMDIHVRGGEKNVSGYLWTSGKELQEKAA